MKIFTNGCFDLVHRGHLELLEYCRHRAGSSDESVPISMRGEVIVGLNSDSSVKRLKGEGVTRMPKDKDPVENPNITLIATWIQEGAKDN